MRLYGWGGIVPWIGFRKHSVPPIIADEWGIDLRGRLDYITVNAFEVEWFGYGCVLLAKEAA